MTLPKYFRTLLIGAASLVVATILVFAGIIVFGASSPPEPLQEAASPFEEIDYRNLPPLRKLLVRDGTALAYRVYDGNKDKAVVMLHGAAGSSFMLHELALKAQAAGFTVYVPDLRGHGASGGDGDIAYNGQLQNDVADLARFVHVAQPGARTWLLGHSAGGCLALRFAGGTYGKLFDHYVLLSPMLSRDAPTVRAGVGGFVKPFRGRYIALTILDRIGFHRLEGLPVLAFAVSRTSQNKLTPTYSYRLSENFTQDENYLADFRRVERSITVMVGANDEFFYAERFPPLIHGVREDIPVEIVPDVDHVGIVLNPGAANQVIAELDSAL